MSLEYKEHVINTLEEDLRGNIDNIVSLIFFRSYGKEVYGLTKREAKEVKKYFKDKGYKIKVEKYRLCIITVPFYRFDYKITVSKK